MIVAALEGSGLRVVASFTHAAQDPANEVAQAVRDGCSLVIAVGGDGTVNAIAKGLWHTQVPLGILPFGTYNNIARSLSISNELDAALAVLAHGRIRLIDGARANGLPFLGVAGVGLDARLFPTAEQIKSGAWYRLVAALGILRAYRRPRLWIEVAGGRPFVARPLLALISNMPYFGVGFAVAPDARPDDGTLILSLFEDFTKLQLVRHFFAIANGHRVQEPRVTTHQGTRFHIATVARAPLPVEVDGQVRSRTPVTFEVVPQALAVLVPPLPDQESGT
jgi:diacylglycerol kinase (ATP)